MSDAPQIRCLACHILAATDQASGNELATQRLCRKCEPLLIERAKAVLDAWDNHFADMPPSLCQDIWKTMFSPIESLREVVSK